MTTATNKLQVTGYYRIWHIVGDSKAEPPIPAILPISRSTFLNGVKSGKYPRPVKLGERTTAWKVSDISDLVDKINNSEYLPTQNICKKVAK